MNLGRTNSIKTRILSVNPAVTVIVHNIAVKPEKHMKRFLDSCCILSVNIA